MSVCLHSRQFNPLIFHPVFVSHWIVKKVRAIHFILCTFFQTCLFGVAAMLWSAADYKLPANQEPALSEDLENMLISMTQDAHWVRPSASDVLQVCA